jgi:signal transduction histidine kinase
VRLDRVLAEHQLGVLVRGDAEELVVEVENAPATVEAALTGVGTSTGLQGLRERVGASGGTLAAGPTPAGGWRLSARLPRRAFVA